MFRLTARPNQCTRHTSLIHGAGCNSEELRRISYVQIPTFVAREMSNDSFTILEPILPIAKGEWLIILESLKRKKRCFYELKQLNKGALTSLKGYIYIYLWCPSGALALNFSRWYLSFIFISTCFGEALASGWP